MRYPPDHKQQTRERILTAAIAVFRREGFAAAGVDGVMAEAGLTAGGFYAHFKSKNELLAAALVQALRDARLLRGLDDASASGSERVSRIVAKYLSPAHRKALERGCPMPPLLAELARQDVPARQAFEIALEELVKGLAGNLRQSKTHPADEQALAMLSAMIGGMTLARAVADEALADRILLATRRMIESQLPSSDRPRRAPRKPQRSPSPRAKGTRPS
jgi:TetR/AcrR family transcriptional repressor of nem operon